MPRKHNPFRLRRFLFLSDEAGNRVLHGWFSFLLLAPLARVTILTRRRDESAYSSIDAYALLDILFVGLCAITLIHQWRKIHFEEARKSGLFLLFLYHLFCAFSFLWRLPGTSMPLILYRSASALIMGLYAYFFMQQFKSPQQAFFALLNYLSLIQGMILFRSLRFGSLHTNSYSVIAGMLLALSLAAWKTGLFPLARLKFYLLFGAIGLLLGTSSGSNVAFACTLLFLASLHHRKFYARNFILGCLLVLVLYPLVLDLLFPLLFPGKNMENLSGMTGRALIWQTYLQAWQTQPWLGLGYAVGERSGSLFGAFYTISAHNGFLSILVNTGILGCTFWVAFYAKTFRQALINLHQQDAYTFPVCAALVMVLVNNNTVPILGSIYGSLFMSAFLLLSFFALWTNQDRLLPKPTNHF